MSKKYIACQGEAEGFGHQACLNYIEGLGPEGREYAPLPRHGAGEALSSLMSHDVERAIIPIKNASEGYFAENLALLAEFKGGHVVSETSPAREGYCLAAPRAQMQELAQAGFSASLGHRGAEGWLLPWRDQEAFRDRIDVIFATPEAERRCGLKLASFRGAGVEVRNTESGAEPAREVLSLARRSLNSDRQITTTSDKSGALQLQSQVRIKSDAQARELYAALLPRDVVARFKDDYVLIDEAMDDKAEMRTRFLVVERKPTAAASKQKPMDPQKTASERIDEIVSYGKPARLLVKVDSRGAKADNLADIYTALSGAGVAFAPVYLHRQPEKLPAVFDIEWTGETHTKGAAERVLKAFLNPAKDRAPQILGVFEGAAPAFDAVEAAPGKTDALLDKLLPPLFWLAIGLGVGANWPWFAELLANR
ncbi:MAG: prephenate dehydratase domain-containing protein [Pseudomonadota bacterium]